MIDMIQFIMLTYYDKVLLKGKLSFLVNMAKVSTTFHQDRSQLITGNHAALALYILWIAL